MDLMETDTLSRGRFFMGDEVSVADLHVFYVVNWFANGTKGAPEINMETHPKLFSWLNAVKKELSVRKPETLTFASVKEQLLRPSFTLPKHDESEPLKLKVGDYVVITPMDTGKNHPQHGVLIAINSQEICVTTTEGARIHFPRLNYHVKSEKKSNL